MVKVIRVRTHYENLLLLFEGSDEWVYAKPSVFEGINLKGDIIKKRTRTWFEVLK